MSQPSKGIVPKFGSFKLKAAPKSASEDEGKRGERSRNSHYHRSRSRSRDRHGRRRSRSPDRERHRDREHRKHPSDKHRKPEPAKAAMRSPGPEQAKEEFEESDFFIVDRRGDKKNVEYGSLHRYSIPAHYRSGNGRILGTPRDIRIDRDASTEKQLVLRSTRNDARERGPRPLASKHRRVDGRGVRLIVPTSSEDSLDVESDFIKLRPSLKRKHGSESPEPATVEDLDYRSIEGIAKESTAPDDEDMEYTTDSEIDGVENAAHQEVAAKSAMLNRKVKDDPTDVQAWLDLIEHQANIVAPGQDQSSLPPSQRRTLADVRLAVYDRALKNVPNSKSRYDKLVLGRLKEGSAMWDNSKLATKWSEALKDNSSSISISGGYLNFVQTDHINFRYEKCKDAYIKCLQALKALRRDAPADKQTELASVQVYVLLRFTSFVRDAGYDELAHGVWQTVLEYHFFKPLNLGSTKDEMEALESFWESDVPRIGEEGTKGWAAFEADGTHGSRTVHNTTPQLDQQPGAGKANDFAQREIELSESLFLPAAADDEDASDDPFRFVLFADVMDAIENLLTDLPKLDLIDTFLCFMRLPDLRLDASNAPRYSYEDDPFLCRSSPSNSKRSYHQVIIHRLHTAESLFSSFVNIGNLNGGTVSPAITFVGHVLQRLISVLTDDDVLAEYYLAFTLNYFPEKAVKAAKRLLKLRTSSLRLYNAYALIEAHLNNFGKAEEVWAAALGMSSSWSEDKRADSIALQHSRMMILVRHGQDRKALRYLVSPTIKPQVETESDESEISAAERLKAMRTFEEGFGRAHANGLPEHAALYVDCLAWLSYLLEDSDLPPALAVYEKYAARVSSSADIVTLEHIHQGRADLLQVHIERKRPFKPGLFRGALIQSINLFPTNSAFHEILSFVSSQNRIDDRLRDALQHNARGSIRLGLVEWLHLINKEIERCTVDGSGTTANSVRTLFSKALLDIDSEVKHTPLLWDMWLQFEQSATKVIESSIGTSMSEGRTNRVRQVIYDGLRYLPWYKPWVLQAIACLSALSSGHSREARQVYDVMFEREMRVRMEFDEQSMA